MNRKFLPSGSKESNEKTETQIIHAEKIVQGNVGILSPFPLDTKTTKILDTKIFCYKRWLFQTQTMDGRIGRVLGTEPIPGGQVNKRFKEGRAIKCSVEFQFVSTENIQQLGTYW